MINYIIYNSWDARIVLKDKTTISFVRADDKCRGYRFEKIIIQPEVDQLIADTVIRPCILPSINNKCYVIDILEYI